MKRNRKLAICTVAVTAVLLSTVVQAQQKPIASAVESAQSWLTLVDAGKYGESWDGVAQYLRSKMTKDQWVTEMKRIRSPLGALKSRKYAGTQVRTDPHGLPPGRYVAIRYSSRFDKLTSATEVVAFRLENGQWRVVGYFVTPA